MKKKWKTKFGPMLIAVLLMLILLMGCGSSNESMTSDDSKSEATEASRPMEEAESGDYGEAEYGDAAFDMDGSMVDIALEGSDDVESNVGSDNEVLANKVDSRKYIRTFRYYIETLTFDEAQIKLEKLVNLNFGFFQSTNTQGVSIHNPNQLRNASFTIRIPKEKVDAFIEGLEGIGNVTDSNSMVEDVTSQYFDTEARIRTLEVQEERLIAILENAQDLEYVLELERELSDVRYEIERYESTFRNLKDKIDYSTITVNLQEVEEETVVVLNPRTFSEKMSSGFVNTIKDIVDFFADLLLAIVINSPIILIWIIIILLLYRLVIKRLFPHGLPKKSPKKEVKTPVADVLKEAPGKVVKHKEDK